jgi:hypothetical protein
MPVAFRADGCRLKADGLFEQIVERLARISRRNRTGFALDRHTNAEQIALVVGIFWGYARGHGLRTFKSRARIEVHALRAAMEIGTATFAAHVGYLCDLIAAPGAANDFAKPRHVRRSGSNTLFPGSGWRRRLRFLALGTAAILVPPLAVFSV